MSQSHDGDMSLAVMKRLGFGRHRVRLRWWFVGLFLVELLKLAGVSHEDWNKDLLLK